MPHLTESLREIIGDHHPVFGAAAVHMQVLIERDAVNRIACSRED